MTTSAKVMYYMPTCMFDKKFHKPVYVSISSKNCNGLDIYTSSDRCIPLVMSLKQGSNKDVKRWQFHPGGKFDSGH